MIQPTTMTILTIFKLDGGVGGGDREGGSLPSPQLLGGCAGS